MSTAVRVARLLVVALALAPVPVRAAVDQFNPWAPQVAPIHVPSMWVGRNGALPEHEAAQTFTVGLSGPLSEVRVFVTRRLVFGSSSGPPLIVEIRPVVAGVPSADASSALVSKSILYYWVGVHGAWVDVNFGAAAPTVTSGQQLAIVLRSTTPAFYSADNHVYDLYTGGDAFRRQGTTAAWTQVCGPADCSTTLSRSDVFFKTYVGEVTDPPSGFPTPPVPALSPIAQGVAALLLAGTAIVFARYRPTSRPN